MNWEATFFWNAEGLPRTPRREGSDQEPPEDGDEDSKELEQAQKEE